MNRKEIAGRLAFEAYSVSVGGKTHDDKPIPAWGDLTESVRTAWGAAASAVYDFGEALEAST